MNSVEIGDIIAGAISEGQWKFDISTMTQKQFEKYISLSISAVINSNSFKSYIKNLVN